ncbi:MAG TPA: DUF1572 family protein [Acidobacteriota bacterium]|nr:DUF1572 family protein [Acidobacteriota bacterium]
MSEESIGREYLQLSAKAFLSLKNLAEKAFAQLSEQDYHWQPDPESNSIAILIQHLSGGMISRWSDFLTSDGEKETRHRDSEFIDSSISSDQLMKRWEEGWETLFTTLGSLKESDLLRTITIREEPHTVLKAINRALSHTALHVGQIIYIAKQVKAADWVSISIPRGKSEDWRR